MYGPEPHTVPPVKEPVTVIGPYGPHDGELGGGGGGGGGGGTYGGGGGGGGVNKFGTPVVTIDGFEYAGLSPTGVQTALTCSTVKDKVPSTPSGGGLNGPLSV